jgi:phosphopantothenoylcysteine decarboxylase / phosphopantothenate---cysteine ligase
MTKLLIGMTGSMGMLAMPSHMMTLGQHFSDIKVIITHSATQFIPKESLSMFCDGIYSTEFPISSSNMMHMELARWAELFIVLPASANILTKAAHGFADTLLSATILAYMKKIIFFPNMNSAMWNNKALQRNIALLHEDGHKVIPPLLRPAFEYASRQVELNHVMPSIESILSILKLEEELELTVSNQTKLSNLP